MWLTKTYTAKEIHDDIYARNIALLTCMVELHKKELVQQPIDVQKEHDRLTSLGLTNSKNTILLKKKLDEINKINLSIEDYNKNVEHQKRFASFLKEMLEVFGHNTLLITFKDFEKILRKYNLTCGLLEHYTGAIPEKNIVELELAIKNLQKASGEHFTGRGISNFQYDYPNLAKNIWNLHYIKEVNRQEVSLKEQLRIQLFPFYKKVVHNYNTYGLIPAINREIDDSYIGEGETCNLFIVAPYTEMMNGVKFTNFVRSRDPFICSYTPFGIMIHTAWGEEAEDEILDKYKALFQV